MVSPKTLVENPWPWLGRLPEYVRQHTGLSTSGRGPVPPGPPWPSVTLSYHPGPPSFSVTALALHHSRSPPWPSVALGYRPGPPSLSPSVALGHCPGPPLSIALSHRPGPQSLSAITLALHRSRSPPRPSVVRRSQSPPWPSVALGYHPGPPLLSVTAQALHCPSLSVTTLALRHTVASLVVSAGQ